MNFTESAPLGRFSPRVAMSVGGDVSGGGSGGIVVVAVEVIAFVRVAVGPIVKVVVVVVLVVWWCGGGSVACGDCGGWDCGCCGGGCGGGLLGVAVVVTAFERVAVVIFVVAL